MKSLVIGILLTLTCAPAIAATFVTIDYPDPLVIYTSANGINSSGQIVGTYTHSISGIHGFRWDSVGVGTIDYPVQGSSTFCQGINDTGDIVGWVLLPGDPFPHGFWMQAQTSNFVLLDFPNAVLTEAFGINNAGQIVGAYTDSGGTSHGFEYEAGTYTDISIVGARETQLTGINTSGEITGSFATHDGYYHGLLLSHGIQHFLNVPAAFNTYAAGVNDRKQVVGYEDGTLNGGFSFFNGNYTLISKFRSPNVESHGVNNSMWMVGSYVDFKNVTHGFLRAP